MKFIFINIFLVKVIFFYSSALLPSNFSMWLQELEPEILDYGVSKQTYSKTLSHLKDVNKKVLPKEVLAFVEPFRQYFDERGIMIEPKREMFAEGVQGEDRGGEEA